MLTEAQVRNEISPPLHPFSGYITTIANLYIQAGADQSLVECYCLTSADINGQGIAAFRNAFMDECEGVGLARHVRAQIMLLPLPVLAAVAVAHFPAAPVNHRAIYAAEIARLRVLRTPVSAAKGTQLAAAALAMDGWFHWVSSGPNVPGFAGHGGLNYQVKTHWTRTQTDVSVEVHPMKQNDFAAWLIYPVAPQPNAHSFMNCWESVLFSAFQAHLVDKVWLQTIHRKAALSYEIYDRVGNAGNASSHYGLALSQAFKFSASVPFVPQAGLIPRKGDILFWDREQHVAIALGRFWVNGQPEDRMMSLWHHNNATFAQLTLEDMPGWMAGSLRFLPCPF